MRQLKPHLPEYVSMFGLYRGWLSAKPGEDADSKNAVRQATARRAFMAFSDRLPDPVGQAAKRSFDAGG